MTPCALCHVDFDIDLSDDDEVQVCLPLSEVLPAQVWPVTCTCVARCGKYCLFVSLLVPCCWMLLSSSSSSQLMIWCTRLSTVGDRTFPVAVSQPPLEQSATRRPLSSNVDCSLKPPQNLPLFPIISFLAVFGFYVCTPCMVVAEQSCTDATLNKSGVM